MLMRTCLIALSILASALSHAQSSGMEDLWKREQEARNKYSTILYDDKATTAQVHEAISMAQQVLKMTFEPEFDKALDASGRRAFVYQRCDITVDLMLGYARLRDKPNLLSQFDSLTEQLLNLPKSPAPDPFLINYYVQSIKGRALLKPMLTDPDVDAKLEHMASLSIDRRFLELPYSTADVEKISENDRIMAISMIYSEAKYNFANWDLVKGLNWERAYVTALEKARKAKDRYEFYNVVREFVSLLSDSHTDVSLPRSLRAAKEVPVFIFTMLYGRDVVVTANSEFGLVKGDCIVTIDGEDAYNYGQMRWGRFFIDSTPQFRNVRIYAFMLLRGPLGSQVKLVVRGKDGKTRNIVAVRKVTPPPTDLPDSDFKILPDGTAYFAFNTCTTELVVTAFRKALPEIQKAGRLVIDVRNNTGGNSGVGWAILTHLIDQVTPTGLWETPQYRAAFRPWGRVQESYKPEDGVYELRPHPDHFGGKFAVLTGPMTFSAAEDFTGIAREYGRVFGEPTGGSSGQPHVILLPGGGSMRMCAKRDRLPDGKDFVGIGIRPHELVVTTAADFVADRDPVLEAALRWLKG